MTKTYKVIPIEYYGVVVDENEPNDKAFCLVIENNIGRVCTYLKGIKWSMPIYRIIGSIGKRLDGVPLIELVDNIEQLAISEIGSGYESYELVKAAWIAGYKANTNKYSEKQVKIAMLRIAEEYSKLPKEGKRSFSDLMKHTLQSLQKQPIPTEVELEIEGKLERIGGNKKEEFAGGQTEQMVYYPKIHNKETNTITAVNYK